MVPSAWGASLVYRNLHLLIISRWDLPDEELPTLGQLLDILEACQSLRHLRLTEIEPEHSSLISRPTITFPNLTYMALDFNSPTIAAYFLSHLRVPESAQFFVSTHGDGTEPEDGILACLPPNLSNLTPLRSMSRVSVTTLRDDLVGVECYRRSGEHTVVLELASCSEDIACMVRATSIQVPELCKYAAIEFLDFSVHLSHLCETTFTDWHQVFSSIPSLKHLLYRNSKDNALPDPGLTTDVTPIRVVLEALTWPLSPDSTASRSLPELTTLQLDGYSQELLDVLEPSLEQVALSRHRSNFSYLGSGVLRMSLCLSPKLYSAGN